MVSCLIENYWMHEKDLRIRELPENLPLTKACKITLQSFKGYLRYKTILCHKIALDV